MNAQINPLADRVTSAASSNGSPGCNGRGLSASTITDLDIELMAARLRLAYECLHTGEIEKAKAVIRRMRAVMPEATTSALSLVVLESTED
jgi:hypothetical protein